MPLRKELEDLMLSDWESVAAADPVPWARQAMRTLLASAEDPESHVSIASFLIALQIRGATGAHLSGFANAIRSVGTSIDFGLPNLVDTCGTGGGSPSFNISTGAALLAAGAGAKVAKHGNRGVTSTCGSADLLEALGITITPNHEKLKAAMAETGFAFLFAPHFYEPMKWVRPIRQKIGVRTIFNQLGPLLNPANAKRQIVGVFHPALLVSTAQALAHMGAERALVVRGEDGMDEISPVAATSMVRVSQGQASEPDQWSPDRLGRSLPSLESLAPGATPAESAAKVARGLSDPASDEFGCLLPSAAFAVSFSLDVDLNEAVSRVEEAAASGRATKVVADLARVTA
jgi:anthranilate phosphoribosyltransferase